MNTDIKKETFYNESFTPAKYIYSIKIHNVKIEISVLLHVLVLQYPFALPQRLFAELYICDHCACISFLQLNKMTIILILSGSLLSTCQFDNIGQVIKNPYLIWCLSFVTWTIGAFWKLVGIASGRSRFFFGSTWKQHFTKCNDRACIILTDNPVVRISPNSRPAMTNSININA